jgi:hypothetical protein
VTSIEARGDSLGCRVNVVVPHTSTDFSRIRALQVALYGVEQRRISRHGIVTEALVAVHQTGDRVTCQSASSDTGFDGERSDGRRDVVGESLLAA